MSLSSAPPVLQCAGVPITAAPLPLAAATLIRMAHEIRTTGADAHLCNAYTLALADKDQSLRQVLRTAAVNLPDGKSVAWANRILHRETAPRDAHVPGPDLMNAVLAEGQQTGLRHYFYGSTPEVLDRLLEQVAVRYPAAVVAGYESPPFRAMTIDERGAAVQRMAASGAQIVWIGLGTPKQDFEAARLATELPLVFVAVGAAFDFTAGTLRRAPAWMSSTGLEWTYRLASEPRRLWKRYLFGNARFVWAALTRRDQS